MRHWKWEDSQDDFNEMICDCYAIRKFLLSQNELNFYCFPWSTANTYWGMRALWRTHWHREMRYKIIVSFDWAWNSHVWHILFPGALFLARLGPSLRIPESGPTGNARGMDIEWPLLSRLSQQAAVLSTRRFTVARLYEREHAWIRRCTQVNTSRRCVQYAARYHARLARHSRVPSRVRAAAVEVALRKDRNAETRVSSSYYRWNPRRRGVRGGNPALSRGPPSVGRY